MPKKIITQEVTLSFPHLDAPMLAKNGKGDPKYSVSLLYAPGANLDAERAAVMEAATEQFGEKAIQMLKTGQLASPFRTDWELKGYPEGTTFINPKSKTQPGLVYAHRDPTSQKPALVVPGLVSGDYQLTEADKKRIKDVFYPGAKVRASLTAFYYDYEGMKKGISFGLNNVQKLGDGPRMDGRKAAQDEFEPTTDLVPADLSDLESF